MFNNKLERRIEILEKTVEKQSADIYKMSKQANDMDTVVSALTEGFMVIGSIFASQLGGKHESKKTKKAKKTSTNTRASKSSKKRVQKVKR